MAADVPGPRSIVRFGPYTLDGSGLLLKKGPVRLRLRRQACRLLALLVERHDQFVSRQDIKEYLWDRGCPAAVDPQERITWCIALIRRALGDNPTSPRYIATREGGYEFLGPVEFINAVLHGPPFDGATDLPSGSVTTPPDSAPAISETWRNGSHITVLPWWRRRTLVASAGLLLVLVVAGALWFEPWTKALQPQQLTSAPAERTPQSVALSPDGKYLAFSDKTGAYLQVIDSAEVHPILSLRGFRVFHISWAPDSTALAVCATPPGAEVAGLFITSIFDGDPPRQLSAGASRAAVSRTGNQIAFVSSTGTDVWVVGVNGDNLRSVLQAGDAERITELAWAPDGKDLIVSRLYGLNVQYQVALQAVNLDTKRQTTVLEEPLLQGFSIARNGRLVCSIARTAGGAATLYETRVGSPITRQLGLHQLGGWGARTLYAMTITDDGRRLAFLQGSYQADAYTAVIDQKPIHLRDVRRITMDDRNDFPTAWTPDGGAIIHHSERNGHFAILKQSLDGSSPTTVVTGSGDYRAARTTPDGQYLFYEARSTDWLKSGVGPSKLMRIPLQGGPSEQILTRYVPFGVRCAQLPGRGCLLMERELRQLVFSRLDPVLGVQEVLAREPVPLGFQAYHWDFSPDGTMVAMALNGGSGSVIRTIDLGKRATHDARLAGSPVIQSLDWAPDASGWYISSPVPNGAILSFVKQTGEVFKLRDQPGSLISWAVPSRDGHRLAILEWTITSNAWMIENF